MKHRAGKTPGKGRMQCAAFLLILVFCLAADGIADTYGPTAFAAVGAAVLGAAAVLILLSESRERFCGNADTGLTPGAASKGDQSPFEEPPALRGGRKQDTGLCSRSGMGPRYKRIKRNNRKG